MPSESLPSSQFLSYVGIERPERDPRKRREPKMSASYFMSYNRRLNQLTTQIAKRKRKKKYIANRMRESDRRVIEFSKLIKMLKQVGFFFLREKNALQKLAKVLSVL